MIRSVLWKAYNPDRLFGGYSWAINEIRDGWNHIYSVPYYVEIPDGFELGETEMGEEMYFKDGCKFGYQLTICNKNYENSSPYLIGGRPTESIKLKVIGAVPENEDDDMSEVIEREYYGQE